MASDATRRCAAALRIEPEMGMFPLLSHRYITAMWKLYVILALVAPAALAQSTRQRDHFVPVVSETPAIRGEPVKLYVRERALPRVMRSGAGDKVVLFVHGAGTPAEVSFDVPYADYSWMGFLAKAGYDVFSLDLTGYGRSTRPPQMNDRCNLSAEQQKSFGMQCPQTYPGALTNIESDWHDITAAVDYIAKLRGVARVNLIGWSQGGPRAGGWAALHPDRVAKLVLLAPAYTRGVSADAPPLPVPGPVFNTQSRKEFIANWDRQAPCEHQYEQAAADSVWREMLKSDPVGARWSPPVRRAPIASSGWGWTTERVKAMSTPTLLVVGEQDKQVDPKRVGNLYEDLGASPKALLTLTCASHNAMWERKHRTLFEASLEWLDHGTVRGGQTGVLKD
jgi:pimeloyl-ACP methyl ester carboxylesterase